VASGPGVARGKVTAPKITDADRKAAEARHAETLSTVEGIRNHYGVLDGTASTATGGGVSAAGMAEWKLQEQRNREAAAAAAEQKSREDAALSAMSPEQRTQYQTEKDRDARFGSDMAWLDPSFQYQASQLGPAAGASAAADPNAIANQNAAMTQAQQFANTDLQFQSPAQQQALMQQWAQVQGGQGAPQFMGNAQQQQLAQQLLGVQAPQFAGDADQRAVLNQALGMSTNTGPGSLAFDNGARQGEQYGNLQGIIAGGGATAIEMADRARQRGDSEAWLRGQREADMADYAERGLTGSGMELQALAADRQSAAGRNSLADLEMAKALEERRLSAINSAGDLASTMRGNTIDEQGLLNNRATSGLSAASSTANSMRDANIREQLGLNEAARAQISGAADITGQMRTQDYNEKSFLDERMTNALQSQSDMANQMRTSQANEQIGQRNAQQSALDTFANTSTNARNASFNESESRASATDRTNELNMAAINKAASENVNFLQNTYNNTQSNRTQTYLGEMGVQADLAKSLLGTDVRENESASDQADRLGQSDANTFNDAKGNYNGAVVGTKLGTVNDAQSARDQIYGGASTAVGASGQIIDSGMAAGIGGAPSGGASSARPPASRNGGFAGGSSIFTEDEVFGKKK
jgi:hypothetical protein